MVWQHCGVTDKPWITAGPIDAALAESAALAEFETALGPAWSRPAAHGIAHDVDGGIVIDRYDVGEYYLSAAMDVPEVNRNLVGAVELVGAFA